MFLMYILLTRHFSFLQIRSWNREHRWPTAKCKGRKSFDPWYYIVTCATLYVSFSPKLKATNVFPKHILKSKARDQSIQASKRLFCHVIVKNFVQRFVKVFDQNWKHVEARNQRTGTHPSWLYCTVVGLSATGGVV